MKNFFKKTIAVLLLFGLCFGLFIIVAMPFAIFKKADAQTWPSRKGVITTSYASLKRGSSGKHGSTLYWKPELCGAYQDSGERFCVGAVRYGDFRFGEGKAAALESVAKYPVGKEVDVFYNPSNPKETVLEAVSSWTVTFTLLGFGAGGLLIPFLLWVFRKQIEPQRYGRE
jgi:hypothetical protein